MNKPYRFGEASGFSIPPEVIEAISRKIARLDFLPPPRDDIMTGRWTRWDNDFAENLYRERWGPPIERKLVPIPGVPGGLMSDPPIQINPRNLAGQTFAEELAEDARHEDSIHFHHTRPDLEWVERLYWLREVKRRLGL